MSDENPKSIVIFLDEKRKRTKELKTEEDGLSKDEHELDRKLDALSAAMSLTAVLIEDVSVLVEKTGTIPEKEFLLEFMKKWEGASELFDELWMEVE